jgi:hypothetical protein
MERYPPQKVLVHAYEGMPPHPETAPGDRTRRPHPETLPRDDRELYNGMVEKFLGSAGSARRASGPARIEK